MTAFEDWKRRALEADILAEAVARGAKLKRFGREWVGPCCVCGGRDRFSINIAKRIFNCRGAEGGDVIKMVQHIDGITFMQACEALTGEPPPNGQARAMSPAERQAIDKRRGEAQAAQRAREAQETAREEDTREAALAIWNAGKSIPGTVADSYLVQRGFVGVDDPVLRFHPALPYPNGKKYPALVCRVDDAFGEFTAIWRIYLRDDGRKADVPAVKLGLGPSRGGAVRIGGMSSHIGTAEGVESALGAWFTIGKHHPVWSCLSTSGLASFEVPLGVDRLTIFPDGDKPIKRIGSEYVPATAPGEAAAAKLRDRVREEGIRSGIAAYPPFGEDYASMWLKSIREVA